MAKKLKIVFLGGLGEIGKNITVFEYDDEAVIIDCGLSFPTVEMPGIDIVIPDFSYLKEISYKIVGLILTHGHEDHIGAVPYLLKEIGSDFNIYGTPLTLALVETKLREHKLENVQLVSVMNENIERIGQNFIAEFIHVSHSVAGSLAVALTTPAGVVFHTGDFKIDYTPLAGETMKLNRIAEIGKRGVNLLLADSTNVERQGYTVSEQVVAETFKKIFMDAIDNRIIIATFASNVDRLQQVFDLASEFKRKVAVSGRTMINVIDIATRVGYLHYDPKLLIDIDRIDNFRKNEVVVLSTGSQGEPMSALTRMSNNEFSKVKIGEWDVIVISASPIPGNEKDVYRVINNLYKLGAKVIYSKLADVHVSGHACVEELKLIHSLVQPKFFIPVHGEYRHLKQHADLAIKLGLSPKNVHIASTGDSFIMTPKDIIRGDQVQSGNVLVDGFGIGDVGNVVLRDRLMLSEDGILLVVIAINASQGIITSGPEIISRGFIYTADGSANDIVDEMKQIVLNTFENLDLTNLNTSQARNLLQKLLRGYLLKKLKRTPMIIPLILVV
ncbi:MAG: ribonuclease J [Clostridia bacterium]|nr:ribonuclease J [Clostridia bacterium]